MVDLTPMNLSLEVGKQLGQDFQLKTHEENEMLTLQGWKGGSKADFGDPLRIAIELWRASPF